MKNTGEISWICRQNELQSKLNKKLH
jgi:hypothetical protein